MFKAFFAKIRAKSVEREKFLESREFVCVVEYPCCDGICPVAHDSCVSGGGHWEPPFTAGTAGRSPEEMVGDSYPPIPKEVVGGGNWRREGEGGNGITPSGTGG